jgi:hypothetical protein
LAGRVHDGDDPDAQLGPVRVDHVAVVGDELPGDVGDDIAGNRKAQSRRGAAETI